MRGIDWVYSIDMASFGFCCWFRCIGALMLCSLMALGQEAVAFEVAAIRPNQSGADGSLVNLDSTGTLTVANATLKTLIRNAYRIQNDQIEGGPKWLDAERYDIQARADRRIRDDEEGPILQNLLKDRFGLKIHWETKERSIYALAVTKNGPKLRENTSGVGSMNTSRGSSGFHIKVSRIGMSQLASILGRQIGRVVQDRTGLVGYYDFDLEFDPTQSVDSSLPSVFVALREQPGLQLDAAKGQIPILFIDNAERASEN